MTAAIYFSPTFTSKKGAVAIGKALADDGCITEIDVTRYDRVIEKTQFDRKDLVVFGAAVYGGRLYRGCKERFRKFSGNQTPCVITVTYGNRHYDDALLELFDLVKEQGFVPVAGAALIGQHTYGEIQVGRPDEDDLKEDREFAAKVKEKLVLGEILETVPGNRPYIKGEEGGKGGNFRPLTAETCMSCGLCVKECPEGAIAEDCRTIDGNRCIACFRCIRICPVQAKNMNVAPYLEFAEMFTKKLSEPRKNEYFL